MRLLSLEVAGFRGFAAEQIFDLDADAVVVVGSNGNGKTSLFDAVLWALSGCIPRLDMKPELLVSKFSETGFARVSVKLKPGSGQEPMTVTRVFDGEQTTVNIETSSKAFRGPEAEGRLIQLIRPEAATAASPALAMATALTQSVYLQQDLIRHFIESVSASERFTSLSELVGAGRITDLQAALIREKAAWTKATNARAAELSPLRNRLALMESRSADFKSRSREADPSTDETAWNKWWDQLKVLGLAATQVRFDSREASSTIDAVISQLDIARRAAERKQYLLDALIRDTAAIGASSEPAVQDIQNDLAIAERQLEEIRNSVSAEQSRLIEARRLRAELKERSEQVRALAELALKCLEERCPVCDQEYDILATRLRLESITADTASAFLPLPQEDTLSQLLSVLAEREKDYSRLDLEFRKREQESRDREAAKSVIEQRLADLNLGHSSDPDCEAAVRGALDETQRQMAMFTGAYSSAESFAVRLANLGAESGIEELRRESDVIRGRLQDEERILATRVATGEEAQKVIEALREVALSVVTTRVKEIEPLLGELYSRVDAHPVFRFVRFLASLSGGKGRLSTVVSDPLSGVESDYPAAVLSSSQMNALAICVFLALNLGISDPPLETAILDDPLQSLDDINLLGLVDLLRRTKDQRQLCVSTHDARFGSLLARKLRPRSSEQRTVVIELDGWSRNGPVVNSHDVKCDPAPIRLTAPEFDAA